MLTGMLSPDKEVERRPIPTVCESFLDDKRWQKILELATFDCYEALPESVEKEPEVWKKFMEESSFESLFIPDTIRDGDLSLFSELLLVKVLRPELAISGIKNYIEQSLGKAFVKPVFQTLKQVYEERGRASSPILMLITPGNDPMEYIQRLAEDNKRIPYQVSLGKGQSAKAKALIMEVR